MNIKIPIEKHKEICDKYISGLSSYKLADEYLVSRVTIDRILHKYNISVRACLVKYSKDISFFEKVDNEEKAYFLGLLYADGCNSTTKFSIALQVPDIKILESFKKSIKYSGDINIYSSGIKNRQKMANLTITNRKICKDLYELGCVPRKSLILKFPTLKQVPDYLIHHFIRGYFDGDGCIHINKKTGQAYITITSSKHFCEGMEKFLKSKIDTYFYFNTRDCTEAISLTSGGSNNIKYFFDYIYKNATIFLDRKYELFLKSFVIRQDKNNNRYKNKYSTFFGITKFNKNGKEYWTGRLNIGKQRIYIGCYKTELEAVIAYNAVAKKYNKPLNNLVDKNKNIDYYISSKKN